MPRAPAPRLALRRLHTACHARCLLYLVVRLTAERAPPPALCRLKKGRRRASWKRRYFCLCDSELFYYYTAEMSNPFQPLGVVSLLNGSGETTLKSDSESALDGGSREAPSVRSPVIIQPLCTGQCALPRYFSFAVHTSSRTWHLAADTAHERDDWVRVLCACGAQLSASSAEAPPRVLSAGAIAAGAESTLPNAAEDAAARSGDPPRSAADAASTSGGDEAVRGIEGILWKRASKVHIAQRSEAETGKARDWVTRHFCLTPGEHTIVYKQKPDDPLAAVRPATARTDASTPAASSARTPCLSLAPSVPDTHAGAFPPLLSSRLDRCEALCRLRATSAWSSRKGRTRACRTPSAWPPAVAQTRRSSSPPRRRKRGMRGYSTSPLPCRKHRRRRQRTGETVAAASSKTRRRRWLRSH